MCVKICGFKNCHECLEICILITLLSVLLLSWINRWNWGSLTYDCKKLGKLDQGRAGSQGISSGWWELAQHFEPSLLTLPVWRSPCFFSLSSGGDFASLLVLRIAAAAGLLTPCLLPLSFSEYFFFIYSAGFFSSHSACWGAFFFTEWNSRDPEVP